MNIHEMLLTHGVRHHVIEHQPVESAGRLAHALHVSPQQIAKTVLLWTEDGYIVCVLPADRTVHLGRIRERLRVLSVKLAEENDCAYRFADCEFGVVSPFGSAYGMKTLIERSMLDEQEIVFAGNNHHQAVRMKMQDYVALELPIIGDFAIRSQG